MVHKYNKKLHEALIVVATSDVDLLSYKGQTTWNKLAKLAEEKEKIEKIKQKKYEKRAIADWEKKTGRVLEGNEREVVLASFR